jgi:hypothetical protein
MLPSATALSSVAWMSVSGEMAPRAPVRVPRPLSVTPSPVKSKQHSASVPDWGSWMRQT